MPRQAPEDRDETARIRERTQRTGDGRDTEARQANEDPEGTRKEKQRTQHPDDE
jgi:hypothetical protein